MDELISCDDLVCLDAQYPHAVRGVVFTPEGDEWLGPRRHLVVSLGSGYEDVFTEGDTEVALGVELHARELLMRAHPFS